VNLPRVSVLIPCHNAELYIDKTLESVLGQNWPNLEVIVVDDGSTDQTAAGAAAARNSALGASTGDFIQFLDADDLIDPEKVALQMARLMAHPQCIASAEWGRFKGDPTAATFAPESNWQDLAPLEWLRRSREKGLGMLFPALWLIPRAVAERAGPWNESLSLGDDCEYFTRVVLAAERVLFCEGARCRYRSGIPGSLSASRDWASWFAVVDLCEGYVLRRDDSEMARRGFALSWQHLAHTCYPYNRMIAEHALSRAVALSPVTIRPDGGLAFRSLSRIVGWRMARRVQVASRRAW
jgi:glycosyltransferase involved in cell wall biosynthesis